MEMQYSFSFLYRPTHITETPTLNCFLSTTFISIAKPVVSIISHITIRKLWLPTNVHRVINLQITSHASHAPHRQPNLLVSLSLSLAMRSRGSPRSQHTPIDSSAGLHAVHTHTFQSPISSLGAYAPR